LIGPFRLVEYPHVTRRGRFRRRFPMLDRLDQRAAVADHTARPTCVVRSAVIYARLAIGGAFLSAVGARFGLWDGTLDLEHFPRFIQFTAEVNAFMPASTIPFLAWAATIAELSLGLALIVGFHTRIAGFGAAILLALFGTAMAISYGVKEPMDYSVFSASAGALLLALSQDAPGSTCADP
jgi:putative oxidoreductase